MLIITHDEHNEEVYMDSWSKIKDRFNNWLDNKSTSLFCRHNYHNYIWFEIHKKLGENRGEFTYTIKTYRTKYCFDCDKRRDILLESNTFLFENRVLELKKNLVSLGFLPKQELWVKLYGEISKYEN